MATFTNVATNTSNRAAYVSRLRRAFLLRVHPDRFRSQSHSLRKGQAEVIQAFSERLVAPDFISYTSSRNYTKSSTTAWKTYTYRLEKKDGSLRQFNLCLDDTVERILESICEALHSAGLANIPLPPPPPQQNKINSSQDLFSKGSGDLWESFKYHQNKGIFDTNPINGINRSFDINTKKGKNFIAFLENLDHKEIAQRKADRLDASAAALVARQAYKFQAIDGTGLGWSSRSLARCLTTLTKTHDSHHQKLQVKSFYPLRLVLSYEESLNKLDLFGGILMLNPGSTQLQWLETLMEVTNKSLELLGDNRERLQEMIKNVENSLNIKIRKGYSCSSREYYLFLKQLSSAMIDVDLSVENEHRNTTKALALDRITITVESIHSCRQPLVTNEGHVQVAAGMSIGTVLSGVANCRIEAGRRVKAEVKLQEELKELIAMIKLELGLTHVYKKPLSTITSNRYLDCLKNILHLNEATRIDMRECMAGQVLGIDGEGRSCHLGDDGSIIIPWNWNRS